MNTSVVPGSLGAIAERDGIGIAESFLEADAIILVDVSGSMHAPMLGERFGEVGKCAYDVACDELARLQKTLPGKVAVLGFSDSTQFAPSGKPRFQKGGTDLTGALETIKVADGCDMTFVVISDGAPNDPQGALAIAARFESRIDTVFIGQPGSSGEYFLQQLAKASGGTHATRSVKQLAETTLKLLTAG